MTRARDIEQPSGLRIGHRGVSLAPIVSVLVAASCLAGISTTGDVDPMFPGGVDPWNVGAELIIADVADGSLDVNAGSDVTSVGGVIGNAAGTMGTVSLSGGGTTWFNSQDLVVGASGGGRLEVLAGAEAENSGASVGQSGGSGEVLVDGAQSLWTNASETIVGDHSQGTLTISNSGRVISGAASIGQNSGATGSVAVEGSNSVWEIFSSMFLGSPTDSGIADLTLSGTGSRVYVGTAAVRIGDDLPLDETAFLVSERGGVAQLSIYNGSTITNSGNAYIGFESTDVGEVTIDGSTSAWSNGGNLTIGVDGSAALTLKNGGTASAGGVITVGPLGTVKGSGNLAGDTINHGTISPGLSEGSVAVTGDYTQSSDGKLVIELFDTTPAQFDTLNITGSATIDGALEVLLGSNGGTPFEPQLGDTFEFLTSLTGVSGSFAELTLPDLPAEQMWQLRYAMDSISLVVTQAGDYNGNGIVDAADYIVWRRLLGSSNVQQADGDASGSIDSLDYVVWRSHFGATAGSGATAGNIGYGIAIPEPPAEMLLLFAFILAHLVMRSFGDCTMLVPERCDYPHKTHPADSTYPRTSQG